MISWKTKTVLSFIFVVLSIPHALGETFYYELSREIRHNQSYPSEKRIGQFITFVGDMCYESDKLGNGVGHGELALNRNYSDRNKTAYQGGCYFGKSSVYFFNMDKSTLNVVLEDGTIYVFKKTTCHYDVKTCSLIRKNSAIQSPESSNSPVFNYSQDNYNDQNDQQHSRSDQRHTRTSTHQNKTERRKCSFCNGGRIEKNDNAPANFGIERPRQHCNECGTWYDPNTVNHYHTHCYHCGGTGYVK